MKSAKEIAEKLVKTWYVCGFNQLEIAMEEALTAYAEELTEDLKRQNKALLVQHDMWMNDCKKNLSEIARLKEMLNEANYAIWIEEEHSNDFSKKYYSLLSVTEKMKEALEYCLNKEVFPGSNIVGEEAETPAYTKAKEALKLYEALNERGEKCT